MGFVVAAFGRHHKTASVYLLSSPAAKGGRERRQGVR